MSSASGISIVIPCMARAAHALENVASLRGCGAEVIVVDYSCPEHVGDRVAAADPSVKVVRVQGERYFDPSAARNAGLAAVGRPWVFFLDADIILTQDFFSRIYLDANLDQYFLLGRYRECGSFGSVLAPTEVVRRIGGYDHRFEGYGGEDVDLFERLGITNCRACFLSQEPERVLPHSVESRVSRFKEKNRGVSLLINRVYGTLKIDIMRFRGGSPLSNGALDDLRGQCVGQVKRAFEAREGILQLRVDLASTRIQYFSTHDPSLLRDDPLVKKQINYKFAIG